MKPAKFKTAPFPYFGGKRSIANAVWQRFGNPKQYIEPFAGSLACLLANPNPASLEVVGDLNFYIANFWRCIKFQPDQSYRWADYPVSHVDLAARHRWLTEPARTAELRAKLADPEWQGDTKIAGWWVWGQCAWIGSGWCERHVSDAGMGVQSKIPHVSNAGRGVADWFAALSARLESVRVIHGDWTRTLNHHYGDSNTAIFFDPPYVAFESLYASGSDRSVAKAVEAWCRDNDSGALVAICGHAGDYDLPGWEVLQWERERLTYGSATTKAAECIWFSPTCHKPSAKPSQIAMFGDDADLKSEARSAREAAK